MSGDNRHYRFALVGFNTELVPGEDFIPFVRVTEVIQETLAKPALVRWAYQKTVQGVEILQDHALLDPDEDTDELLRMSRIRPEDLKEERADEGTEAHAYLNLLLEKHQPVDAGNPTEAAILKWWKTSGVIPVASEVLLYSLKERYAGRSDSINSRLDWPGKGVTDLKTRKPLEDRQKSSVYSSDKAQIGAYRVAWNEMHPDDKLTWGSVLIARFDGTIEEEIVGPEWDRVWLNLRDIYRVLKGE